MAKPRASLINWSVAAIGQTFSGVDRKVAIKAAKKDTYARRFFNKNYTTADDLTGAIAFWLGCRMPKGSLQDFLDSIKPVSGWKEDEDFHPTSKSRRARHEYSPDFVALMNGWWDKWEK